MTVKEFKKSLAQVFDDNLQTRQWHNYVDYAIIFLILLSTAEIFISTFPISPTAEKWMKGIDWFTQIFFTIEVSLRIWTADELDPRYNGFWGRVRYCFSFYGLIDFLATYPFWINYLISLPVAALKSIRILRLFRIARMFRIFRYMKAFRFLGTAIRSKKNEMMISLQFLIIITVALSFILYFVEHDANPEMIGNGWESFVWAFAKYIGDPGKVADEPIVTVAGQIISFIVGILGIAIFAVPIGLLGTVVWYLRMTFDSIFVHMGDKWVAEGKFNNLYLANVIFPQIYAAIICVIPCFLAAYFGANYIQSFIELCAGKPMQIFSIIGGLMPALGIAITMMYIFKGEARVFLFLGFMISTCFGLPLIQQGILGLLAAIIYVQLTSGRAAAAPAVAGAAAAPGDPDYDPDED